MDKNNTSIRKLQQIRNLIAELKANSKRLRRNKDLTSYGKGSHDAISLVEAILNE